VIRAVLLGSRFTGRRGDGEFREVFGVGNPYGTEAVVVKKPKSRKPKILASRTSQTPPSL
jgi:hypothetical protein